MAGRPGTLYVFFHGLFIFSESGPFARPDFPLQVVLPKVPGHMYRAGTWLAEDDINTGLFPSHPLQLQGVQDGGLSFFTDSRFIVDLRPAALNPTGTAAALFLLPQPRSTLKLLHAVNHTPFVAQTASGATFKNIAMAQVLVYDFADENAVFLDGHFWEPCATGGAISLHIISTSLEPETAEHEQDTNTALSQVLSINSGLTPFNPGLTFFNNPRSLVAPWVDPVHPDYGDFGAALQLNSNDEDYFVDLQNNYAFAKAELEHPTLRFARMKRLGRLFQRKEEIGGLWTDSEPIGDRASNCATVGSN